jgi:WD40 repeat protein
MYRAVKFVSRRSFKQEGPFQRELSGIRKFEPISRSHEGFVDVLHVGISADHESFYYVMELGDDASTGQAIDPEAYLPKTLDKEISTRGRLAFRDCLGLGLNLSQALAELHQHGLVHRDIKPSNIIFVNGVPKLADIGLVAEASSASSFVGTEGFIPPEGPGTPQADVFSLGKLLYEASTGRDRQEFPELPTQLDQLPDCKEFLELNEVILQACRTDPRDRYKSAWEMHADLLVLANGQSVRRLKVLERRWSKVKKVAGLSSVAALALLVVGFMGYREWKHAIESRQQQVGANVALGTQASESGDRLAALPYFAKAVALDRRNAEREYMHRLRFGSALNQCPKLEHMWFLRTDLNDVCFNPQGGNVAVTEFEGKAWLLDAAGTKSTRRILEGAEELQRASYNSDGQLLVTASLNDAAVWAVQNGSKLQTFPHPDKVYCANFSPDNSHVVTAGRDNLVRIWGVTNGQVSLVITGVAPVMFAGYSPTGDRVISASRDGTVRMWRASDGAPVGRPFEHSSWVGYAAMSPDGTILVTACFDHKARIWEPATGRRIQADLTHKDAVTSVDVSADGRLILTASLDDTACVWNMETPLPVLVLRHTAGVARAAFAPDGRRVITACTDGSVRIWDLAGSATPPLLTRRGVSRDGTRFIVGVRITSRCSTSCQVKKFPQSSDSIQAVVHADRIERRWSFRPFGG